MPGVITGVSSLLRRPQTFHRFTYSFASRTLTPLPLRIALIGAIKGGTGVAGTVYEVNDADQSDALFGTSTELSLMCRTGYATGALLGQGPKMFACGVAESGGNANVKTITVTGPATADGNAYVTIAGRRIAVGIRVGDVQNNIATAIANTLKTYAELLPVIVTVATNVVTLTHATKGVNGADVVVTTETVAGVGLAVANTVAGTGATDHQPAIDALAAGDYDVVVFANHAAADITQINTDIASRWNYAEKRWRWYVLGEMGSIGTATALASAANHQAVLIASMEGCLSTAGEMATALGMAILSRDRPNANYDGVKLPLYPPAAATIYTPTEVETAIAAGLTPLTAQINPTTRAVVDGVAKIERMITTKTTQGGNPFEVLRDLCVSRVGVYLARQYDIGFVDRFGADANPDGALLTEDMPAQIKDMIEGINREAERAQIIKNVETDLAELIVEVDQSGTVGRVNADVPYTVVVGLHQIAVVHRVQVGP